MYDTLLFDFDGTLAPSLELWLQSFQYALGKAGRAVPEDVIIRRFFYREFDDVVQEFDLPSGAEFGQHVHDGLMTAFATVTLFPGARDVLHWCRAQGLAVGLVTSSPRPQVERALAQMGIADFFPVVVTGSDVAHFKPHPEPVLLALKMLDKPASGALFIGDYQADILAGHAAGTQTALFLPPAHRKFYDFAALRALGPAFEFTDWAVLQTYLQVNVHSQEQGRFEQTSP